MARAFGKRFGDVAYAVEKLVAELRSDFLCAELGVTPERSPDHAGYLAHWLEVLKTDKRAVFTAIASQLRASAHLERRQLALFGGLADCNGGQPALDIHSSSGSRRFSICYLLEEASSKRWQQCQDAARPYALL